MARLRRAYWWLQSVLRDRDTYLTLFSYLPRAIVLRLLRATARIEDVKIRLGRYCSLKLAIEILAGRYELQERSLLSMCLDDEDVVLELGTGIGLVATLCARRLGSDRVSTFEANPELVTVAKETFQLNGVAPRIENYALGAAEGVVTFYVEDHFWSSSTVKRTATSHPITVPVLLLSEAIRKVRPTILIVDIEGGETTLFDGVALDGVRKIMIELHPRVIGTAQTQRVRDILRRAGFTAMHERGKGTNVLFERVPGDPLRPTA